MEIGLLCIRVAVGISLSVHGLQKLFGWFGGLGLDSTANSFAALGYRAPRVMALLAGATEASGVLLIAGLVTPLGCAAAIGVMINATVVAWEVGPRLPAGVYEYPLLVGIVAVGLAFLGAGRLSLDRAFAIDVHGRAWSLGAVVVGVVSALVVLLFLKTRPAPETDSVVSSTSSADVG